jgi:molybdate transport system substrate-binding protein
MSTWSRIAAWATMLFLGALVAGTGAMAREITVVSTAGPMPIVMGALIPIFERATGNKVVIKFEGVPQIYALLKEGADLDLVIAEEDVIQELVKRGDIADNSKIMLSRVDIAVRAGALKPDIGTADALKAALIAAKSVAYSQDASGRHFVTMISRLKLANTLGPKSIIVQDKRVAAAVAAGEAEIGVQQVAELLPVPGIDIVGQLPGDMQKIIVYVAGVPGEAHGSEAAKALVKFLTSAAAVTVLKQKGMDPSRPCGDICGMRPTDIAKALKIGRAPRTGGRLQGDSQTFVFASRDPKSSYFVYIGFVYIGAGGALNLRLRPTRKMSPDRPAHPIDRGSGADTYKQAKQNGRDK